MRCDIGLEHLSSACKRMQTGALLVGAARATVRQFPHTLMVCPAKGKGKLMMNPRRFSAPSSLH